MVGFEIFWGRWSHFDFYVFWVGTTDLEHDEEESTRHGHHSDMTLGDLTFLAWITCLPSSCSSKLVDIFWILNLRWWFQTLLEFSPQKLGKIPILTYILFVFRWVETNNQWWWLLLKSEIHFFFARYEKYLKKTPAQIVLEDPQPFAWIYFCRCIQEVCISSFC